MHFNRLISFLTGYLVILIRGAHLEKIINLMATSGLYVWDIRRLEPQTLEVKIRAHGFKRLREMIHRTGLHAMIVSKRGWPFIWRDINRRKIFLLGAVAFTSVLFYLSSFVFFINVDGFTGHEKERLLNALARKGLKPGVTRRQILERKNLIEREIMVDTPNAVWLGITIRGIVAEIKVVKRKNTPHLIKACDIVAGRSGVITKLITIRGIPVVKEGDSVARGDLLISGSIWYNDPQANNLISREVPANGIVEARVWYDLNVSEPKIVWRPEFLPSVRREYKLRWGPKLWTLFGWGEKKDGNYSLIRQRKRIFQGRNPIAIVELIKDNWQEVNWRRVRLSDSEVRKAAVRSINEKIRDFGLQKHVSKAMAWREEDNFLKLMVTLETTQDIATVKLRPERGGKEHHEIIE